MHLPSNEVSSLQTDIVLKQNSKTNKHINAPKNKFLLDTGSTIKATVLNADLITNICISNRPTVMSTNAGLKVLNLDGDVKSFGIAKYDPSHMANVYEGNIYTWVVY